MIKVNLLPVKKKKKSKPIPGFLLATAGLFLLSVVVMGYLVYFFNSRIADRKDTIAKNEKKIADLEKQIKSVENFEKLNVTFQKNKEIIEQLGKNKTVPVKLLDEMSTLLSPGIWLNSMDVKGAEVSMSGAGFTNSDVVFYVNSLKNSKLLSDVYLHETVQAQQGSISSYTFRITCKVKV